MYHSTEYIESWGRGIQEIRTVCKEHGNPAPEFRIDADADAVFVTFYPLKTADTPQADHAGMTTQKTTQKLSVVDQKILTYLSGHETATREDIAAFLGTITADGVKYHLAGLQKMGILSREGGRKSGRWVVAEDNNPGGSK